MKKILFLAVCATAMLFGSCQKSEETSLSPSPEGGGGTPTEEIVIPAGKRVVMGDSTMRRPVTKAYNDRWDQSFQRGKASGYGYYDDWVEANMTVTPISGWGCNNWLRNGKATGSGGNFKQSVDNNYIIVPYFYRAIIVSYNGNGGTPSVGSKAYVFTYLGDMAQGTVSYAPETATLSGSDFEGWFTATTGGTQVTAITETLAANTTLYARWGNKKFTINASGVNCTVTGGGQYKSGAAVTVVATPSNSIYEFNGWYEGSTKVSSNASYTFTVSGNRTLQAKYTKVITISVVEVTSVAAYSYYYTIEASEAVSRDIKVGLIEGWMDYEGNVSWTGSAMTILKGNKKANDLYGTDVSEGLGIMDTSPQTYDGIIYKFIK